MRKTRECNRLRWIMLVMSIAILMAGCSAGGGGGGGGGGSGGGEVALDCSATGHPLAGCWYGNQIRLDSEIGSLSIAVSFDGDGKLTGFEQRSADEENDGIFLVTGEATVTQIDEPFRHYLVAGPEISSELYVIPNDTEVPTHFGYVQSMMNEGWIEVGMFQKTKPSVWPPSNTTAFDWGLLANDYAGVAGRVLTGEDQDELGDLDFDGEAVSIGTGEDHPVATGNFDDQAISTLDLFPTEDTFNDSRGILEGDFSIEATDYYAYLVPSPDGLGIVLIGCDDTTDCLNPSEEMGLSTFANNLHLTWQWLVVN